MNNLIFQQSTKTLDFTQCDQKFWSNTNSVKELVEKIKVANEIIVNGNGVEKRYKRKEWSTGYEDVLNWHCENNKKSRIIFKSFNTAFEEMPKGQNKESIKQFILRNHMFIGKGKTKFDFSNSSISHLADAIFLERFEKFTQITRHQLEKLYKQESIIERSHKKSIAILTCNAGGGHRAVANAMKDTLNNHESGNFRAEIINVDLLKGDMLNKVTSGAVKTFEIFSKFRCQENDHGKADAFCDLRWELHQFIPQKSLHEVNKTIQKLRADIILNTIHHETKWLSPLSDLGCPIRFINTDYELPPQLDELSESVKSENFKVLTPIDYQKKNPSLQAIGYPIRPGFETKASEEEKQGLRDKYGVKENESLVVIQMGSLAMGLEKNVKKLIQKSKKLKTHTHFVFLCAGNVIAKQTLENFSKISTDKNISLHPIGMQDDHQLGLLYQACDVVIGKPGGATSAEIAATGAYLLALDPLPWELPNLIYLKKRGQTNEISHIEEAIDYINARTDTITESKKVPEVLDWKENLVKNIDQINLEKSEEIKVEKPISHGKASFFLMRHIKKAFNSLKTFVYYLKFWVKSCKNSLFKKSEDSKNFFRTLRSTAYRLRKAWKYT